MTILVAGCGSANPTGPATAGPPDGAAPGPLVACQAIDAPTCEIIADAAVESLGTTDPSPVWLLVRALICDEACPAVRPDSGRSFVTVETGGPAVLLAVDLDRSRIAGVERIEDLLFLRQPASPPATAQVVELTLGHCGLDSGIDIDGSFWNPVGAIPDHPDAINSAVARFTFVGRDTARLTTDGGLLIDLVRHRGGKSFPGCD